MATATVEKTVETKDKPFDFKAYLERTVGRLAGCKTIIRPLSATRFRINWYDPKANNIAKSTYVICELAQNGEVIVTTPKQ